MDTASYADSIRGKSNATWILENATLTLQRSTYAGITQFNSPMS
jgi:hypothetical protein